MQYYDEKREQNDRSFKEIDKIEEQAGENPESMECRGDPKLDGMTDDQFLDYLRCVS